MTAAELLVGLGRLGVSMRVDRDALRLTPASAIPPRMLGDLRAHKVELMGLLAACAGTGVPAPPIDLGNLPAGPCSVCGNGLWWRLSSLEPRGPGLWQCERCQPPDPTAWRDACCCPGGPDIGVTELKKPGSHLQNPTARVNFTANPR